MERNGERIQTRLQFIHSILTALHHTDIPTHTVHFSLSHTHTTHTHTTIIQFLLFSSVPASFSVPVTLRVERHSSAARGADRRLRRRASPSHVMRQMLLDR
jgi:hypothetical protein